MENKKSPKDLEDRILKFILRVGKMVKVLPKTQENRWYGFQVNKSVSSMGANYAEATCALTRRDFTHDINKCRKEGKESLFWLNLIAATNPQISDKMSQLIDESEQLVKIFQKSIATARKNNEK